MPTGATCSPSKGLPATANSTRAFVEHGALQCGFCTPGFVLAVKALLRLNAAPSEEEIRHFLRGNICRCTGYIKILEAVKSLV